MNKLVLALSAIFALNAAQAFAETAVVDTDGDGFYSMEELLVAYPDLTEDGFSEADSNEDGKLDASELATAEEEGVLEM